MTAVPLNVTETMKGYIGFGATDHDAGFIEGIDKGIHFMHDVVIHMDDIDRFVNEPTHQASMTGTITCEALGGKLEVKDGTFNMLLDEVDPGLKIMLYRMPFLDGKGQRRTMLGHKTIHNDKSLSLWPDITTLYIRVFDGDVQGPDIVSTSLPGQKPPTATPAAMGVLHIETADGIKSALSFRSPGSGILQATEAAFKFGAFYFHGVWPLFDKFKRVAT